MKLGGTLDVPTEYVYAAITPVDVRCLPLLTLLPPAHPAYPPYWLLLPGFIHRTRPVIPRVLM